jgi:hypothetical protein
MLREYGGILDEVSQALDLCLLGLGFYFTVILYSLKQVLTGRLLEQYFLIFLVYILCWVISSRVYRVYQSGGSCQQLENPHSLLNPIFYLLL